jgi:hypothetical protein
LISTLDIELDIAFVHELLMPCREQASLQFSEQMVLKEQIKRIDSQLS